MPVNIFVQSTHMKIDYSEANPAEISKSEGILKVKFTARDASMARNPLVKKGILSDIKNFYNEEYKILPTGFLAYLEAYYEKANIDYTIKEMRKFPEVDRDFIKSFVKGQVTFGSETPRDYQKESVFEVVKNRGGVLSLPTASGKTLIMAAILKCYPKVKILCIFNTIDLIAQTYDKLKAYGFKPSEVGVIQGNNFDDTKRITLLSVQSYEKAYNLFTEVKVIICDEVHETGRTESSEKVIYSCQNAPIHIGLSATPWSDNDAETMRLYGNIGPIIYQKEFKEQMDSDYIAQTEVEIYSYQCDPIPPCGTWSDIYDVKKVNNTNTEEKLKRDGYTIVTEGGIRVGRLYVSPGDEYTHIINNEQRNKKIIDVIKKYVNQKKRILVIYNRVEHGEILKQLYPDAILIHGEHDISERKKAEYQLRENDATVVLASGIWRKGIDIEEVDVYINAAAGKASTNVIQKLGRVVRKSRTTDKETAIVVDFDDSNLSGIGRRQTAKRLKIYNDLKLPVRTL